MIIDLKKERCNYVVKNIKKFDRVFQELKDAPLMIRRIGLPLALAYWTKDGDQTLVVLISNWIFKEWNMIAGIIPPETLKELLNALERIDSRSKELRSAMEYEVEQLLQAAKMITVAIHEVKI